MKKIILKLFLPVFLVVFLAGISHSQTVLSGIEGASNHRIALDMQKYCNRALVIKPTNGSMDNFKNLVPACVAFMQYDVLQQELYYDLANITNNCDSIRVLLSLGNEEIHLIMRSSSNVNYIGDLNNANLKISVGSEDQGTAITASIIKKITNSQWTDVNISFKESIKALLAKEIDGLFFVGSAPVDVLEVFSKLAPHERNSIKLVPLSDKRLEVSYSKTVIKAGTYAWANYDVPTYTVKNLLITKVSNETLAQKQAFEKLLSAIKLNIIRLQKEGHRQWRNVDFNFNGVDWEIHPVAKKIFKQAKTENNANQ